METELKYFFEGQERVIHVLENGGSLVKILGIPDNTICPLMNAEIKIIKTLGEGGYGFVYEVETTVNGKKIFAMKEQTLNKMLISARSRISLDSVSNQLSERNNIPSEITKWANNYKEYFEPGDKIVYPTFAEECRTKNVKIITRYDRGRTVKIPIGSYICGTSVFSEFAISSICSKLYSTGVSAHFLEMYNFALCKDMFFFNSYTFMEIAGGNSKTCMLNLPVKLEVYEKSFIVQILHTIAVYQSMYKISHNDLHLENIFYVKVCKDSRFNGQSLYDAEWFHYSIGEVDLYLPALPYIVKIADFGRSFKWSEPIVGDRSILYDNPKEPWIPNWYLAQYDSLYFLKGCVCMGSSRVAQDILNILGVPDSAFRKESMRPIFSTMPQYYQYYNIADPQVRIQNYLHTSAIEILKNQEIVGEFLERPTFGKIVTLGTL